MLDADTEWSIETDIRYHIICVEYHVQNVFSDDANVGKLLLNDGKTFFCGKTRLVKACLGGSVG